ncbi:MAG: hypothetical protein ACI9VS_002752, partial [Candidatus Binatia bacterium]
RRLDVEAWRDSMLRVTDELRLDLGGNSTDLEKADNQRRTIYGTINRRDLNKMLRLHDFPDPTAHAPTRAQTTTPLQQLFTLNGPFIQSLADALAETLIQQADGATKERVDLAYLKLFQRQPTEREQTLAAQFLKDRESDQKAWSQYAQALLGGNEFLFVD